MARKKKNETNLVSNPESKPQDGSVEVLPKVNPLTDEERNRLEEAEWLFEKFDRLAPDVITALIDIRDNRLYRETHDTFEAYCSDHLKHTRRQADRLIAAFPINKALADAGLPKLKEGAIREVADLPPEKAVEVVQAAKDENPDAKLTAENVRNARQGTKHRKDSHRVRRHLNEQDAQELEANGNNSSALKEPYTDEEIVISFCSWFAEFVDGLQDDKSCTEERVLKPVLYHILVNVLHLERV